MRHKSIREKALLIDEFIKFYNRSHNRRNLPRKQVNDIVRYLFPESRFLDHGAFKWVYRISSRRRNLVLKIGRRIEINKSMRTYRRLPRRIRNRYFGKIYWQTKYTLLQRFGREVSVPAETLSLLKSKAEQHGLWDVRAGNIRLIDGKPRIIDALSR